MIDIKKRNEPTAKELPIRLDFPLYIVLNDKVIIIYNINENINVSVLNHKIAQWGPTRNWQV